MFNVQFNAGPSRDAILRAVEQLGNPVPMFEEIGEYMVEATRQRFISGEAPDGSKWAPKKPSTLERYRRLGYGNRTRPLIGAGQRLSREIVRSASKGGVVIGSALIYSGVMQNGAAKGAFGKDRRGRPLPWGDIPARVWLGISAADSTAIVEIADDYIGGPLETGG